MAALYDPPRPDSAKLIEELRSLSISTKMLTGDALPIARQIACEVKLGDNIAGMGELKKMEKGDPEKAEEIVEESDGFAGVYPEDEYLIVKALQAKKHVVGMTGSSGLRRIHTRVEDILGALVIREKSE